MASLNSGSSEKGQGLLDLSPELPVRGYDIQDLQRNEHIFEVQANVEEPNSGLSMGLSIRSVGRLDHVLEYLLVCGGAVATAATAAAICHFAHASSHTTLSTAGAVGALVIAGGLVWVVVRRK